MPRKGQVMIQEQQNSQWYQVISETRTRELLRAAKNISQEGYQHKLVGNPQSKLVAHDNQCTGRRSNPFQ